MALHKMKLGALIASTTLLSSVACTAFAADITVCPEGSGTEGCDFIGNTAIQQAVDAASDGAVIKVMAGVYKTEAYKDAPFQEPYPDHMRDVMVRAAVLVENKAVTIKGEGLVSIIGNPEMTTSAVVVHDGMLDLENISLSGFTVSEPEDPIYDGHGIFVIDSDVSLKNVSVDTLFKMALVIRGDSKVDAQNISISTSHMGLWLAENGTLTLDQAVFSGNHTGFGAYDNSVSHVSNIVIKDSIDDGVYALGKAQVTMENALIMNNKPFAVRALDSSKVDIKSGGFYANDQLVSVAPEGAKVTLGKSVFKIQP
ncbi:right-handed parallel beta-helix repeat-containing protein [Kordiimonas pumila]|uniref:Right-handed parallel beta-helix repeat-containing protein n=1 Tax=Kordiimonas pumila TaxID=2161677 RepID=A0ABV7D8M0_9PROT|nr:right-handed parallel beta-helix repeat-containing protein [Kordiimonas pumila]